MVYIDNEVVIMAKKAKMKCNKVYPSDRKGKKKMVKACQKGKEKLIHFGASGYKHNYSAGANVRFRSRMNCDEVEKKKDMMTAKYWACSELWPKRKKK